MADEAVITPDAEVNAPTVEGTTEQPAEVAEQTIEDLGIVDAKPESRFVDEHVFVAEKKARKAAEKAYKAAEIELEQLRSLISSDDSTQEEIDASVSEFSEKYDINPDFINDLDRRADKLLEKKLEAKLKEIDGAKKFDSAFDKAFATAIERGPEFQAIANPDVIKTLAQLPQNSRKTVSQLLEETYGNALTGKRTIETTTPGGGKDPEPLDIKRAEQDIEYYKQVMADPKKKAQYNAYMLTKG